MELDLGTKETPVVAKAKEMCETIVQQEQFKGMLRRIDQFMADAAAQQLYQAINETQERLVAKQEQGMDLAPEEIEQYERQREALFANEAANGFISARQEMQKVQDTIMRYVNLTFELGRVPTDDDLQAGSGGGCCGGAGAGAGAVAVATGSRRLSRVIFPTLADPCRALAGSWGRGHVDRTVLRSTSGKRLR